MIKQPTQIPLGKHRKSILEKQTVSAKKLNLSVEEMEQDDESNMTLEQNILVGGMRKLTDSSRSSSSSSGGHISIINKNIEKSESVKKINENMIIWNKIIDRESRRRK